jgi:hypothetical protein
MWYFSNTFLTNYEPTRLVHFKCIFKRSVCLPSGRCDVTPKHVGSVIKLVKVFLNIVYELVTIHVVIISAYRVRIILNLAD